LGLTIDHVGGYNDRLRPQRQVGSWTRVNANVSYRLAGASGSEGLELMLSGLNLFDAAPPFVDRELGYDPANAEPLGRIVSFYVRKDW
jgi:iron complex outermembrane receptor protein